MRPPPAPNTQPGLCKRPGVGTQTLVPLNFSAVVAPLWVGISDRFLVCQVRSMICVADVRTCSGVCRTVDAPVSRESILRSSATRQSDLAVRHPSSSCDDGVRGRLHRRRHGLRGRLWRRHRMRLLSHICKLASSSDVLTC